MMEVADIAFEKGWMLKGVNGIYSEHKTRKVARSIKKIHDAFKGAEPLTIYKYFKILNKDTGAITLVMTKSS